MDTVKRGRGRPRKDEISRYFYDGKLHALLVNTLPAGFIRAGRVNVSALSTEIGFSEFTLYRWMLHDRVTVDGAKALLQCGAPTLRQVDLLPFLFA